MLNTLRTSFKIEMTSAINSFIYLLKHTPLLKEIFSGNLYKSKTAKALIRILAFILSTIRMVGGKFLYFFIIFGCLELLFENLSVDIYIHVFLCLSLIGMMINDRILAVGKKKYYAVILMKMNAKQYVLSYFIFHLITTFILNFICLLILCTSIFQMPIYYPILVATVSVLFKIIGEAFNIFFYKKKEMIFVTVTKYYFSVLLIGLGLASLPIFNICMQLYHILIIFIISIFFGIGAFIYILKVNDYYLMYKKINTQKAVMSAGNEQAYSKQMATEIRKKDYKIDEAILEGKKGYDYFNTIFFLRHKVILSNSANIYTFVALIILSVATLAVVVFPQYKESTFRAISDSFAWIMIVMYFVNRGAIITQAMFFNCDRSMLTFNFYRQPQVILNVFKQRLKTVAAVNLRPAIVIGVGLTILFITCTGKFEVSYLAMLLSIILLSVFFSVHYLVIYYLLQPYNIHMEMKSVAFSIVSFLTYLICYLCKDIKLSFGLFSVFILVITCIYIILALIVVHKKAPETFRLK